LLLVKDMLKMSLTTRLIYTMLEFLWVRMMQSYLSQMN